MIDDEEENNEEEGFQDDQSGFDDIPDDGSFEDFEGGGTTLGDMWRNNPLVKIGVIAGGLITIVGAIILFGGRDDHALVSRVRPAKEVSEPPGGEVSESYKEAIREENVARTEEAIRGRGSSIATPVDSPVRRLQLPEEDAGAEDPLERWRRIQEERQRQTTQKKPEVQKTDPYAKAIDELATAMAAQMDSVLGTKDPLEPDHVVITEEDFLKEDEMPGTGGGDGDGTEEEIVNILIPAGTIEYGQLIVEANSDMPGPILAHLVSGPLAGSRLLGSFKVESEFLILTFDTIVIDGVAHSTEAVALDPETTTLGMVTDIDHRYFTRIILPAAASFVEGIGGAIGDAGSTTTVGTGGTTTSSPDLNSQQELYKGIEKAAEKVSEMLDEDAENTEILIRVESGTPMGLLFVQPVTDETGGANETVSRAGAMSGR